MLSADSRSTRGARNSSSRQNRHQADQPAPAHAMLREADVQCFTIACVCRAKLALRGWRQRQTRIREEGAGTHSKMTTGGKLRLAHDLTVALRQELDGPTAKIRLEAEARTQSAV